jgi:hypothetical protein
LYANISDILLLSMYVSSETALDSSVQAAYASNGAFTWQKVTDRYEVIGSCSDPDGIYQITVVSSGAFHYFGNENGFKFS